MSTSMIEHQRRNDQAIRVLLEELLASHFRQV